MNKTQFYTLSSALLASTALSGAANAGTIGRYDTNNVFTTTALTIANTVFSTTASTANAVVIGGAAASDAGFGMKYNNNFSGTTAFTTEFTISGARFITAGLTTGNFAILTHTGSNTNTAAASVAGSAACASVTALVDLLVVNDCNLSAQLSGSVAGIKMSGVTFNNASGLATAGSSVTLTGRVYNPANTSQIFEASSTGTIITSAAPIQTIVTAGANATAAATTTPIAFANLSQPNDGSLSLTLASVRLSSVGALDNTLVPASAVAVTTAGTTSLSLASSVLSAAAIQSVRLDGDSNGYGAITTVAAYSSGTVTFTLTNATWASSNSVLVAVSFTGSAAIPAAVAGTVTGSVQVGQQAPAISGATAAISQGGFRAEVNTFNASTNGPFGSYLRIHNNGSVAGTVTITIRNDDHTSGAVLGSSFTTAAIQPGSTMQLSAAEMEGTATSTKLPAGGADVPVASRFGSYTLSVTGPIVGYVQHILFDGESVADLSGFRNAGANDKP